MDYSGSCRISSMVYEAPRERLPTRLPTHICVHSTCLHQPTGRKLLIIMVGAQGLEPRTSCV
jgi:hypothetical protein